MSLLHAPPLPLALHVTRTSLKSVAKVTSMTGAWPAEITSGRHLRRERGERSSSGNRLGEEETLQRLALRAYAWVRSAVALTRTPVTATATRSAVNPLSVVGVGCLMTPRDCDFVLAEAQGSAEWDPWDGDLGEECTARCLEDLPDSRALWDGSAGEIVRARIARNYGVRQSAVVSDASDVFVCKAPVSDYVRVENEALNLAARVRQHDNRNGRIISADFRRSRSLVTFSIQLSPRDAQIPSWVLCFEQQGRCVMPVGQGSGLIFSGKMRHASLATHFQAANDTRENVVLLRGFADIRGNVARWGWGRPAWHLNAPWVKDEKILNRVWVASAARGGEEGGRLERMNTSLAHRYYRQGLGGMNVPVVNNLGRPEVDLQERGPKWWNPGSGRVGAEITIIAALRRRHALDPRRLVIGKAGLSTDAGTSPRMDAALRELFGASREREDERTFERVAVPPIKYVFVDPRYRGFGLGRRLFLEAMSCLARRGFRFALIVVEDNGSGSLFDFYEQIGFVRAEEQLGLPRAMIAPIPPPESVVAGTKY